jgi:hypothetical protein
VALTSSLLPLVGLCPATASVVDYASWGSGTTACLDGTPPGPAPANNTQASGRKLHGCQDTFSNSADLVVAAVAPRNGSTALYACATANESNLPGEADSCLLQSPSTLSVATLATSAAVFGRIFEATVTEVPGAAAQVRAQVGYGPVGTNPETEQEMWTWFDATFNAQLVNDDEYQGTMVAPAPGTYRYGFRFSLGGQPWTYCDQDGAGSSGALRFDPAGLGTMTVTP